MSTNAKSITATVLALGFLTMAAATASAGPGHRAGNKRGHDFRVPASGYIQAKRKAERKINIEFNRLDKNQDGLLTRRDFATVQYKWVRIGHKWVKQRRLIVSPAFHHTLRLADFDRNRVVTRSEYKRAKLTAYINDFMPQRPHRITRAPEPAPRFGKNENVPAQRGNAAGKGIVRYR